MYFSKSGICLGRVTSVGDRYEVLLSIIAFKVLYSLMILFLRIASMLTSTAAFVERHKKASLELNIEYHLKSMR